ncbi:hypothetical protein KAZ57_01795 [Patescibacteria group bacterium]|nr:hypothetical protein [Patescibacteria group bacterium]
MKNIKLNKKGFSAVEIVVALVVIVGIAGLGVFAYNSRSKSSTNTPTPSSEVKEASAAGTKTLPSTNGPRAVGARVCANGQNSIRIVFTKNDSNTKTDFKPELVFARNGSRTGSIVGYNSWSGGGKTQSLGNRAMGNRRSTDTLKVKFGSYYGAAIRWNQVPYC